MKTSKLARRTIPVFFKISLHKQIKNVKQKETKRKYLVIGPTMKYFLFVISVIQTGGLTASDILIIEQ